MYLDPGYFTLIDFMNKWLSNEVEEEEELSNEEVVLLYREGKYTLEAIIKRLHPMLLRFSQIWIPDMSNDDLYQESLLILLKCCDTWDPGRDIKFSTYLYSSLKNFIWWRRRRVFNTYKRSLKVKNLASWELLIENGYDAPEEWSSYHEIDLTDGLEMVEGVHMSDRERLCVDMIILGFKKVDISKALNCTEARVSQIFRGLRPRFEFLLDTSG